ncbi:MAG TPA: polyprenyl diphosphate synthase [Candidatus Thalassarchaeaceae archaeon]|nr:polyprenyl diphosphate synthase [Candidatus Thalassarchaeaceae archaeon]
MGWLGRSIDASAKWLLKFRLIRAPARWLANSRFAWSLVSRTDRVRANRLRDRIFHGEIPQHVSIIMDGNRRFAENEGLDSSIGHRYGKQKLEEVMDWVLELDIPYLTVYALSTENVINRTEDELEVLFDLYVEGLEDLLKNERIFTNRVKVQIAGHKELLPKNVIDAIENAEKATANHDGCVFTICLAYGSREEILVAVRSIAEDHASGEVSIDEIDEKMISKRLYTGGLPDPDLIIRTSGEERISNFLLWQAAYSELYFTDVFWPSFSKSDFFNAIESYQNRRRRFGE